jgi:hypothetical protein
VSDQWSQFDSEQANRESKATEDSSANGVSPDYAIGVADPLDGAVTATEGESAQDVAAVDEASEEATSEATSEVSAEPPVAEATVSQTETPPEQTAPPAADDGSAFIAELARAMQATAGLERLRIGEDIDRRRQEEVDRVQARKASEADRMRELANEDMAAIDAWVDRETARIQLDRERRVTAVREDLAASLAEHGSKIDKEIEGIDAAIAAYRADVDAFFASLDRETDPIVIAQRATSRPKFPALAALGEVAAAPADAAPSEPAASSEPDVVGVMDPAAPAEPVESWTASPETAIAPDPVESSGAVEQVDAVQEPSATIATSDEPVSAGVSPTIGGPGALLQSIPAKRPMSWLRRSDD